MPLVARRFGLYLPIRIFSPELVADDRGRHLRVFGDELGRAVAADEQDVGVEGLALVPAEAVDEEPLALVDAVLLAAECDDRVAS